MEISDAQFGIAVPGAYVVAIVAAVMVVPAAVPSTLIVGALVVGLAYAFRGASNDER